MSASRRWQNEAVAGLSAPVDVAIENTPLAAQCLDKCSERIAAAKTVQFETDGQQAVTHKPLLRHQLVDLCRCPRVQDLKKAFHTGGGRHIEFPLSMRGQ